MAGFQVTLHGRFWVITEVKSRDHELLIREIFQQGLGHDYVPKVVVEHDVEKQGLSGTHQIDVYW